MVQPVAAFSAERPPAHGTCQLPRVPPAGFAPLASALSHSEDSQTDKDMRYRSILELQRRRDVVVVLATA
jgi:hypothetical protein